MVHADEPNAVKGWDDSDDEGAAGEPPAFEPTGPAGLRLTTKYFCQLFVVTNVLFWVVRLRCCKLETHFVQQKIGIS